LRGWRDYYCDSDDRWLSCARYKVSLKGRPIPITLLPNGHDAQYLIDRTGAAEVEPGSAPVSVRPFEPSALLPVSRSSQSTASPPARLARPERRAQGSMRRWWTRLTEWMTSPA